MKKIVFSAFASLVLVASSFAGHQVVTADNKGPAPIDDACFADQEVQLDIFGSYTDSNQNGDGFGGGLGVNYFFTRHIGVGGDVNIWDGGDDAELQWTVNLIARWPIESGSLCLAPYAKVGYGHQDGDGYVSTTAGLEFRINPKMGIFGEGVYNWGEEDDFGQLRAGLRFVF